MAKTSFAAKRLETYEITVREYADKAASLENKLTRRENILIIANQFLQAGQMPDLWVIKEIQEIAGGL